jgi:hypothetical protein
MQIAANYATTDDLSVFDDMVNALAFPYPQCERPSTAAPSPSSS